MNIDEAMEFWQIVGEPANPEDLHVGDAALLENARLGTHKVVIVTKCMVDDDGNPQVVFRDALPGEVAQTPTTVLVVE